MKTCVEIQEMTSSLVQLPIMTIHLST